MCLALVLEHIKFEKNYAMVLKYFLSRLPMLAVVLLFLQTSACKEKKSDYDRKPLLENLGNNVIVPAYKQAQTKSLALKVAIADFTAAPDVPKLQATKTAFKEAYIAWQAVENFDFGKATGLTLTLNNFPADTVRILSNLSSGSYDLNQAGNLRAKGFPALDFILFSVSDENMFVNTVGNFHTKQYLNDVAADISNNITAVYDDWNAGYLNTFTAATNLDLGGSVSILCNSWAQYTERSRRERVGNSLGYVGLIATGNIDTKMLEAFYSNYSKELLIANLQAGKNIFTGGAGIGFDDYPQVKEASFQGVPLNEEIANQYDKCIAAANQISTDFKTALTSDKPKMESLFLELKKLTVLVKVDLASAVGVTISYADNDGD